MSSSSDISEYQAALTSSDSDDEENRRRKSSAKSGRGRSTASRTSLSIDRHGNSSASSHERRSGKRKSTRSHYDLSHDRARRKLHTREYLQLLNEQIRDASSRIPRDPVQRSLFLSPSQLGVTRWSCDEKEAFFGALSRLGKDDLLGIAAATGTKSESEVFVYLNLLRQGLVEKELRPGKSQILRPLDLPAAYEISQDCCTVLDRAAESLEQEQQRYEEYLEKAKWGKDRWLLTPQIGDWAAASLEEGEAGVADVEESLPSAVLLRLECWLELSSRIFMNPAPPKDDHNWRNLAGVDGPPAIRYTAFADFHTLAVEFTKKLMQTALFYATSRLRATDANGHVPVPAVIPRDVQTACKVLGVRENSRGFWTGAARRCGLDVYQRLPAPWTPIEEATPLRYEDVEMRLMDPSHGNWGQYDSPARVKEPSEAEPPDWSSSEEDGASSDGSHPSSTASPALSSDSEVDIRPLGRRLTPDHTSDGSRTDIHNRQSRPGVARMSRRALEREQDQYAEAMDQQASMAEEQRLWAILHFEAPPPRNEEPELAILHKEKPWQEKRTRKDLVDWRHKLQYWDEWETLPGGQLPSTKFFRPPAGSIRMSSQGDGKDVQRKLNGPATEDDHRITDEVMAGVVDSHSGGEISQPDPPTGDATPPMVSASSRTQPRPQRRRNAPSGASAMGMVPTGSAVAAETDPESGNERGEDSDESAYDSDVPEGWRPWAGARAEAARLHDEGDE